MDLELLENQDPSEIGKGNIIGGQILNMDLVNMATRNKLNKNKNVNEDMMKEIKDGIDCLSEHKSDTEIGDKF